MSADSSSGNSGNGMDFDRGELVRLRMDPLIVGQVIGEKDWGSTFLVRLGGVTEAYWFENIELETYVPDGKVGGYGDDEEPPKRNRAPAATVKSNIINLAAASAARKGRTH